MQQFLNMLISFYCQGFTVRNNYVSIIFTIKEDDPAQNLLNFHSKTRISRLYIIHHFKTCV